MRTILIADPNRQVRELLVEAFTGNGWRCVEEEDGRGIIERVHDERPDVIVMEPVMPHRHGLDVMRSLRDDPVTRDIPIIILSAWPGIEMDEDLRDLRPWCVRTKPVNPIAFIAEIEACLGNAKEARAKGSILVRNIQRNGNGDVPNPEGGRGRRFKDRT